MQNCLKSQVISCGFVMVFLLLSLVSPGQLETFKFKYKDSAFLPFNIAGIEVIDQRTETRNLGYIIKSFGGPFVPVLLKDDLPETLNKVFSRYINTTNNGLDLLLNIRIFNFSENNQKFTGYLRDLQFGFFRFRAELFKKSENSYLMISKIDTLVEVHGNDATGKLFKAANKTFFNWLENSLYQPNPSKEFWTRSSILEIDNQEKAKIPLFTASTIPDGIYKTYASFARLVPDVRHVAFSYDEGKQLLTIKPGLENEVWEPSKKIGYALAFQNKVWMLTEEGYSRIYSHKGSLYFQTKVRELTSNNAMSPLFMFGALGGAIVAATSEGKLEFITYEVDHLNGGWTPVRKGL